MKRIIFTVAIALIIAVIAVLGISRKSPSAEKRPLLNPVRSLVEEKSAPPFQPDENALKEILKIEDFHTRTNAFRAYFSDLCRKDPAAAARLICGVEAKFRDYDAVEEVARAFAAVDIHASLEFADQIDSARQADFIRLIALKEWGIAEPTAAANYIIEAFPAEQQGRALSVFATDWGKQDPTTAMEFADRIGNPSARGAFVAEVFEGWSQKNPKAASQAFADIAESELSRVASAGILARNWSERSPEAAARWANALSEEDPARSTALNPSIAKWTEVDPASVSQFLHDLPRSQTRDKAVAVFVGSAIALDAESATEWAKNIDRQDIRRIAFQSAANHFAQRDPSEGQAWINSLGELPESWVNDLLRRMNQDGSSQTVTGP